MHCSTPGNGPICASPAPLVAIKRLLPLEYSKSDQRGAENLYAVAANSGGLGTNGTRPLAAPAEPGGSAAPCCSAKILVDTRYKHTRIFDRLGARATGTCRDVEFAIQKDDVLIDLGDADRKPSEHGGRLKS